MISVSKCGPLLLLRMAGDLDATDAVALRNAIAEALDTEALDAGNPHCQVIVDVSATTRLGWRGLALLVDERAILMSRGGELRVVTGATGVAANDPGLARLFHLHGSLEEALAEIDTDVAIA